MRRLARQPRPERRRFRDCPIPDSRVEHWYHLSCFDKLPVVRVSWISLAKYSHAALYRRKGAARRTGAPHGLDQSVDRYDTSGIKSKDCQHDPLLRRPERDHTCLIVGDRTSSGRNLNRRIRTSALPSTDMTNRTIVGCYLDDGSLMEDGSPVLLGASLPDRGSAGGAALPVEGVGEQERVGGDHLDLVIRCRPSVDIGFINIRRSPTLDQNA
jgi:hypothetical protein